MDIINKYIKSKPLVGNFLADKFTNNKKTKFTNSDEDNQINPIVSLIHIVIFFFALYLAWRCNAGFWGYFVAIFAPEIYIIFRLVAGGWCGVLSKSTPAPLSTMPPVPPVTMPTYTAPRT